jgi:hypothetical protein
MLDFSFEEFYLLEEHFWGFDILVIGGLFLLEFVHKVVDGFCKLLVLGIFFVLE